MYNLLQDTFADETTIKRRMLDENKAKAIIRQKEIEAWEALSDEEKANMEELIPENRRGQVDVSDVKIVEVESFSQKVKRRLSEKYESSDFYKKLKESEEFKEYEEESEKLTESIADTKDAIKDNFSTSDNKAVDVGNKLMDFVKKTGVVNIKHAFKLMRQRDPKFDLFEFEDICKGIFMDAYVYWKEDDIESLKLLSESEALGFFKVQHRVCTELEVEHYVKIFLNLDHF